MKNIFKDYVTLKHIKELNNNRNGRFVNFTFNKKTKKINIPYNQIKDIRDTEIIKKLVNEKIDFIIKNNYKSFTGKFI